MWTHGFAAGPKGRFAPYLPTFWTIWAFSKNKEAAKSLLTHLSQPSSIEKLVVASGGYDLPASEKLTTLKVWAEAEPPKGAALGKESEPKPGILPTGKCAGPQCC